MADPRAQRTLVKSPPELWAEVSDHDALTRHLNEFGSIRITRTDPETTVAWEGDRVRGTVELEATGWGTKVTLTAAATAPGPAARPTVGEEEAAPPVAALARAAAPLPAAREEPLPAARRSFLSFWRRTSRATASAMPASSSPSPPPDPAPVPPLSAATAAPDPLMLEAVLVGVLDDLGSATKRPFSR